MFNNSTTQVDKIRQVNEELYIRRKSYLLIKRKERDQSAYVQPQEYSITLPTVCSHKASKLCKKKNWISIF